MVTELIRKYVWLIQTLADAGERGLTFGEISDRWAFRFDAAYPPRSFTNHRKAIEEVFGIEIRCDRSTNRYYIPEAEDAIDMDSSRKWLLNTFTVNELLTLGKTRLSGRVSVEDIPSGHRHLIPVMDAMLSRQVLEIQYRKYSGDGPELRHVRPYAVKEAERRWYLVGHSEERGAARVYAMDRIIGLRTLPETFHMPEGFNVDELFSESYGVYLSDDKAVTVQFQANELDAKYLNDLPLHHSQRETDPDRHIFRMRVVPNAALVMELCRYAGRIRILAPASLREAVAIRLRSGLELLENDDNKQ